MLPPVHAEIVGIVGGGHRPLVLGEAVADNLEGAAGVKFRGDQQHAAGPGRAQAVGYVFGFLVGGVPTDGTHFRLVQQRAGAALDEFLSHAERSAAELDNISAGIEKQNLPVAPAQHLQPFVEAIVAAASEHDDSIRELRLVYDEETPGADQKQSKQQQDASQTESYAPAASHGSNVLLPRL